MFQIQIQAKILKKEQKTTAKGNIPCDLPQASRNGTLFTVTMENHRYGIIGAALSMYSVSKTILYCWKY
jgi:hypothetical protein